uniref:Uncharacterized protein n=1 Tax=Triticum urartu TaxID=4572 RepID=A0A8R7U2W5_TRIUA
MRPKSVANLLRPKSPVAGCASSNLSAAPFAIFAGLPNKEWSPSEYRRQLRLYLQRASSKYPPMSSRLPSHPCLSATPFHPGYMTDPKTSLLQRRETELNC